MLYNTKRSQKRLEDYRRNPKYRLLNPEKSQLGKISKQILQKINKTLRSKLNLSQCQNPVRLLTG